MQLKRVDPLQMRERIVDFFWRSRMWPLSTEEEYYRFWDWRYSALSEIEPAVWIALEGETIIGHIAMHFRHLHLNGQKIRAGILDYLRIEDIHRQGTLAAALIGAPRAAARRGELDLVTGYGSSAAHRIAVALGYRDLGAMRTFVKVLRWSPILRRRHRGLTPLAPLVRAAARVRWAVRGSQVPQVPSFLEARDLTAAEIKSLDLSHWQPNGSLNWNGSLEYYANRFCTSEFNPGRVLGVFDSRTHALEAIAAVTGSPRLMLLQCDVNERALSRVQAVEAILRTDTQLESARIPMLPQTALAKAFTKVGYTMLPSGLDDQRMREKFWSAWWRPQHPLAADFSRTTEWNLWSGWTQS